MSVKKKLVMVGNGMAGVRTIEELLKLAPEQYDITIIGTENFGNYNRIMLSPVLADELAVEDIITHPVDWYEQQGISLRLGTTVVSIDRNKCEVVTDSQQRIPYDRLLLATGSSPFVLPVEGVDLEGVLAYRDIQDVNAMLATAKDYKKAVVIGGGLLGLEAANGLNKRGMEVTVVHKHPFILERQLDEKAAGLLRDYLEQQGIAFRLEAITSHFSGSCLSNNDLSNDALSSNSRVEKIHFKDGSSLDTDLVVMAAGIRPRMALAVEAGLPCDRAVLVNDCMQTYDPKIYAVGECAQHRGVAYGLVAPLYDQAKVCANHLAEIGIAKYSGTVLSTKLKVTGVNLFSAGDFNGDETTEIQNFFDPQDNVYKKLVLKEDALVGAVMYGDTQDGAWYFDLIQSGESVAMYRDKLIFGQALC